MPRREPFRGTYATIDLNWLPILSISLSALTILSSFYKTTSYFLKDNFWYLRCAIFLPIFIFRMTSWLILVVILAEMSFILFVLVIIANAVVILIVQKNNISFEPVSFAVQSLVFPLPSLTSTNHDKQIALKIFCALTVSGNVIQMTGLTLIFILCSADVYNPWKVDLSNPILIPKSWFEVIYQCTLTMFVSATLPLPILLQFKR